jgi:flavorubredoxin
VRFVVHLSAEQEDPLHLRRLRLVLHPRGYLADPSDPSYLRSAEKYMVTVMGHYREHVLRAVEKVRSLGVSISRVAPSHGGVWEGDPEVPMKLFEDFARGTPRLGGVALAD